MSKNCAVCLSIFQQQLYARLRQVPRGKVTTYQDLANAIGSQAYRAVGTAMNKNPFAPDVPCHRVIKSNGEVGEYAHGSAAKIALLLAEGVEIKNHKIDLGKFKHHFSTYSPCFAND